MERRDANTVMTSDPMRRDIVCIYSQVDELFYLQLKKSLKLLERGGEICWLEVLAGEETAATWQHHVKRADLILLLLSPDFFADELCYQTIHLALQERTSRQVPVVPVLVRAVNWRLSACKDLAIVPHNEQPVASWTLPDEAYTSISADLVRLVPGWLPIPSPARPRLFQARDLPKGYVPRPKVFNEIKHQLLNHQGNQTTAITTALRGAGGFGKTTLALALCHDAEIQAAFPDGILWVELGEQPSRSLDILNRVVRALEPSSSETITLKEAEEHWKTALQDRKCLLVIDDVWQVEALLPLLGGGPHCRQLVTTRNDLLLPRDATRVLVDTMEPRETVAVLCQGLPVAIHQAVYQSKLEALAACLGYWPLLLTLANGLLTDLVDAQMSITEAFDAVDEAYQTRGVTAFRLDNVEERQQTVDACLRVSLQHLDKFTHLHYHAIERYQELAVFPEDTDIPLATLEMYWKGSAGLEPWETKDLCMRLHRLSLLLTCDLGTGTIRLHDVMRNYLNQRYRSREVEFILEEAALHGRFLDACQQEYGLTRWADLPLNDIYLWKHLIFHFCEAFRFNALKDTLSDLQYLARKALYRGASALTDDFDLACASPLAHPLVANLSKVMLNISDLLKRAHTSSEIGNLLLSHLDEELTIADQRYELERELPRPFLVFWHPLRNRTFSGHTYEDKNARETGNVSIISACAIRYHPYPTYGDKVTCCVVARDGYVVSASGSGTLKVWDAASRSEHLTLSGHRSYISSCAVSDDSRMIISASYDCTLKVWDAVTGVERLTLSGHTATVHGCAVSKDGSVIISASEDRTLKVWDAVTGACLLTCPVDGKPLGCTFHPDGEHLVVYGRPGMSFLQLMR